MKLNLTLSIVACLFASQALAADKDALQGAWIVESAEVGGKEVKSLKGVLYTFSGNTLTVTTKVMGTEKEGSNNYKTDSSKSPNQIDFIEKGRNGAEKVSARAIYKIEGDMLTLCGGLNPDSRPTTFDSTKATLMVLKRKKSATAPQRE